MSRSAIAVAALCLFGSGASAQSPDSRSASANTPAAAPAHKHYEVSEQAAQPGPNGELAPRLQSLGSHTFPVSTKHAEAQRFMDQGLNLAYAFNHAEARRGAARWTELAETSSREAARTILRD